MMKDYKRAPDNDLAIEEGDFTIIESTAQHQRDLLVSSKGEIRQYPLIGVDIGSYLNDDTFGDAGFEIRKQFELDGMDMEEVRLSTDGSVEFRAEYRRA